MSEYLLGCISKNGHQDLNQCLSTALESLEDEAFTAPGYEDGLDAESVPTQFMGPFGLFRSNFMISWTADSSSNPSGTAENRRLELDAIDQTTTASVTGKDAPEAVLSDLIPSGLGYIDDTEEASLQSASGVVWEHQLPPIGKE